MNPLAYLCLALALALPATYGTMKVLEARRVQAAYEQGRAAGAGSTASAAVAEVKQAATDYREAEAETPLDADREYFKRLCGQSASCALRSKYQGGK
jgi:hypothetical protein